MPYLLPQQRVALQYSQMMAQGGANQSAGRPQAQAPPGATPMAGQPSVQSATMAAQSFQQPSNKMPNTSGINQGGYGNTPMPKAQTPKAAEYRETAKMAKPNTAVLMSDLVQRFGPNIAWAANLGQKAASVFTHNPSPSTLNGYSTSSPTMTLRTSTPTQLSTSRPSDNQADQSSTDQKTAEGKEEAVPPLPSQRQTPSQPPLNLQRAIRNTNTTPTLHRAIPRPPQQTSSDLRLPSQHLRRRMWRPTNTWPATIPSAQGGGHHRAMPIPQGGLPE